MGKSVVSTWRDRLKKNVLAKVEERRDRKNAKAETLTSLFQLPGGALPAGSSFEDAAPNANPTDATDDAVRALAAALRGLDHNAPWFLEAAATQCRVYASKWHGRWRKGVGAAVPDAGEAAEAGLRGGLLDQKWWVVEHPSGDQAFTFELVNAASGRRLFARKLRREWVAKSRKPLAVWETHVGAGPPSQTFPDNLWRALPLAGSASGSTPSFVVQNAHSGRCLFSRRLDSAASDKKKNKKTQPGEEESADESAASFGAVAASRLLEVEFSANAAWRLVPCGGFLGAPPKGGISSGLTALKIDREDSDSQEESEDSQEECPHGGGPDDGESTATSQLRRAPEKKSKGPSEGPSPGD
jgi:hypothetical protein